MACVFNSQVIVPWCSSVVHQNVDNSSIWIFIMTVHKLARGLEREKGPGSLWARSCKCVECRWFRTVPSLTSVIFSDLYV
jgi:hypothetical protein